MSTSKTCPNWRDWMAHYAWIAVFLCLRAHYFLTMIVGPVFGWR